MIVRIIHGNRKEKKKKYKMVSSTVYISPLHSRKKENSPPISTDKYKRNEKKKKKFTLDAKHAEDKVIIMHIVRRCKLFHLSA